MSPVDIFVVAAGSVVTLWVWVRRYKKRGVTAARAERLASESVLGEAMITKLDFLGYIKRSETVAARLSGPLWVFGLSNADDWLLPGSGGSLSLFVLAWIKIVNLGT